MLRQFLYYIRILTTFVLTKGQLFCKTPFRVSTMIRAAQAYSHQASHRPTSSEARLLYIPVYLKK
jgi:hypothetical protein